ncbi:MAG: hypothetical protein H0X42_10565 [Solirubrobacterales bacterium]|nr:hypothetical protein [Solirubrobacterales bacterium]
MSDLQVKCAARLVGLALVVATLLSSVLVSAASGTQTVGQPPERGQWKLHARNPNTAASSMVVHLHGGVPVISQLRVEFGDLRPEGCESLRDATVTFDHPLRVEQHRIRRDGSLIEREYAVREPSAEVSIAGVSARISLRISFFNTGTRENGNVTTRMLSGTIEPQGAGTPCRAEFAGTAQRRGRE